ncbi:MAG: ribosomal protein S18-alanine N-acetyltransferase [Mogibacterium diversum]|jgi:ribosomal-protein-alanine acetyltransferase|uniref:ribosomal protein S18-alanine N-acetyltransferase n=1 Tax=Mogibacterium diversum TaxID=114527 RepID=UPI001CB4AA68|nr:ribosomal protein S18-alanine N-acetyltransferase [Mogibacterium diversum]MBF1322801.1 ribosomal protein S18-alanine N-acetyltransferase [Mogibacterium diversum]MBF1340871.1 ribosomal protein S18-alanine N-acetyltransferase [Mogibacterium diversum]MBF1361149.1 ribosomal protein S18-alanine N-acetyltransferase [Mogibacterium diversum]
MIMEICRDKAKIRVRIAKSSDLDDIYDLDVQTFAMPWSKEALSYDILENDNAFVIVAEYEGEFAGYADIWTVLDEADLNSIAVRVDFRRKGIGDAIMLAMTEMLSANGVATINLEVRVSNMPAIKLYKKYGFNECGVRPGYYLDNGEDALIMKRETGGYA